LAFSDFTLETAQQKLGITTEPGDLFPTLPSVSVPAWLPEMLARGTQLALVSEKSRSEFIVAPILTATRELAEAPLSIYSGYRLDVDPERGLVGECDFILAVAPPVLPLRAPIATVVEAKKNDVEAGLGQCVAEMVAASVFNQAAGATVSMFGCVTTGETWQFLRLDGSVAQIDRRRFYLDNLPGILSALQAIVQAATARITSSSV
jgi:hypothetical protein